MMYRSMAPMALALALALAACAGAPPVPMTLLSLPSMSLNDVGVPKTTAPSTATPVLSVRRVRIPEYLQANQVRYRDSDSTLAEWPQARWAERLEVGLTRHLLQRLQAQLGGTTVCEATCATGTEGHELSVDYLSLDYLRATGQVQAQVSWRLTPQAAGKPVRSGQLLLSDKVTEASPAAQAAAIGRINEAVAREVVAQLRP